MVNTSCAVYKCGSTTHRKKDVKFHQFPKDERSHLWIKACKRPDLLGKDPEQLKHMHICSLHFEQRMYGKLLLKKSAMPTLNLPDTITITTCTQTGNDIPDLQILTSQGVQTDDTFETIKAEMQERFSYQYEDQTELINEHYRTEGVNSKSEAYNHDYNQNNQITLEQFMNACDTFLPDNVSGIVKAHIRVQGKT